MIGRVTIWLGVAVEAQWWLLQVSWHQLTITVVTYETEDWPRAESRQSHHTSLYSDSTLYSSPTPSSPDRLEIVIDSPKNFDKSKYKPFSTILNHPQPRDLSAELRFLVSNIHDLREHESPFVISPGEEDLWIDHTAEEEKDIEMIEYYLRMCFLPFLIGFETFTVV